MRYLIGVVAAAFLMGGGAMLVHLGIYGLTAFMVIPVLLGACAALVFRPPTAPRAAAAGALQHWFPAPLYCRSE